MSTIRLLWGYSKILMGKWIFDISLLVSILGFFIGFTNPQFLIPRFAFWVVAYIGLFVAGFQIYESLVPGRYNQREIFVSSLKDFQDRWNNLKSMSSSSVEEGRVLLKDLEYWLNNIRRNLYEKKVSQELIWKINEIWKVVILVREYKIQNPANEMREFWVPGEDIFKRLMELSNSIPEN